MGKKIYLGTMIEALKTQIDAMATKLDTQITALGVHTTKLGEISAGISQGLSSINVKSGITDKSYTLNAAIKDVICTTMSTVYSMGIGVKSFCDGVVKFSCVAYCESSNTVNIGYAINGAAAVFPLGADFALGTTHTAKTFDIPVKFGDSVQIVVKCVSSGGKKILFEAGSTVSYDLVDIISEGAFSASGL